MAKLEFGYDDTPALPGSMASSRPSSNKATCRAAGAQIENRHDPSPSGQAPHGDGAVMRRAPLSRTRASEGPRRTRPQHLRMMPRSGPSLRTRRGVASGLHTDGFCRPHRPDTRQADFASGAASPRQGRTERSCQPSSPESAVIRGGRLTNGRADVGLRAASRRATISAVISSVPPAEHLNQRRSSSLS